MTSFYIAHIDFNILYCYDLVIENRKEAIMAQLNINSATYGRDTAGAKKLLAELQKKISTSISALKGSAYTDVVNTVKKYWSGADADKFLSEFANEVTELQTSFKRYNEIIQTAMANDAKGFAGMQETNAGLINR